jgi:hypothetical protein
MWLRAVEDGRVLVVARGGESSRSPRGLSDGRQTALLEPLLTSSACVFLLLYSLVALWEFCGLRVSVLTLAVVSHGSRVCTVSNLQSLYSEYKSLLRNRGSLCWVTHSQLCCLSTDCSSKKQIHNILCGAWDKFIKDYCQYDRDQTSAYNPNTKHDSHHNRTHWANCIICEIECG